MNYHLSIQHTYNGIELGLFDAYTPIQLLYDDKKKASQNIVALVKKLLENNNASFDELQFISANQGPGPFTTLRVVIASVNGLAFASKKKLIGIDGINALLQEYASFENEVTVALLNAYSGDIYFGIEDKKTKIVQKGYQEIESFLKKLKAIYPHQIIRFIGQAVPLYINEILEIFEEKAFIQKNVPEHCSIKKIGLMAWEKWTQHQEEPCNQLFPMYLKTIHLKKQPISIL